ncbi:hypothetical protein HG530_015851 [Fusarium avenaceum]|nr:hypothetical protein DER45DRAFT_616506 [Fusarium avenaceum]KAI6747541.1 hypothetical protein HG530_015851 [Fusarium avenaceum]
MPGKPSDWDNSEFLMDLTLALYTGAQVNKGLTPAIKDSIEEYLKSRGYSTSFDAVRAFTGSLPGKHHKFCALWCTLVLLHETPSPFTPQPKV